MVRANRIKHLDGNGAALNEIAYPAFLKVVSTVLPEGLLGCRRNGGWSGVVNNRGLGWNAGACYKNQTILNNLLGGFECLTFRDEH